MMCHSCIIPIGGTPFWQCSDCGYVICFACDYEIDDHDHVCDPDGGYTPCVTCSGAGEVQVNGPYEYEPCPDCQRDTV